MAGIDKVYEDLSRVIKEEENKPLYKKKGTVVLQTPERNQTKHTYSGFCRKLGDNIEKVYPDFDNLLDFNPNYVRKVLKRGLNNREYKGFTWLKICEL